MSEDQPQAPMGFFARFAAVFFEPSRVFQELKRRPTWLVPLLAVTLAVTAQQATIASSKVGDVIFREAIEKRAPNLSPEQIEQQLAITRYAAPIGTLVFAPVITVAAAGLLYLIFSVILGGEGTFRQTLSAWTHVGLIGLVQVVVGTVLVFVKGNAKSSTALSAFLPFLDESSFLYKVFQGFDLFILWQLAVLSVGMGIIQQTGTKKAATAIFSTFLVIILGIAAIRQAF